MFSHFLSFIVELLRIAHLSHVPHFLIILQLNTYQFPPYFYNTVNAVHHSLKLFNVYFTPLLYLQFFWESLLPSVKSHLQCLPSLVIRGEF